MGKTKDEIGARGDQVRDRLMEKLGGNWATDVYGGDDGCPWQYAVHLVGEPGIVVFPERGGFRANFSTGKLRLLGLILDREAFDDPEAAVLHLCSEMQRWMASANRQADAVSSALRIDRTES